MRRLKQRIGAVLAWAVAAGYRTDNPARGPVITSALPRGSSRQRQRAVHHSKVAEALATIGASGAYRATVRKLFRENSIGCVPHGMRSSFRDWCGESGVPREVRKRPWLIQ